MQKKKESFYIIDHQPCPNGQLQFWGLYQTDKGEKQKQTKLNKNKKDIYTNNDINYNYDFNKPRIQTINVSWCSVCIHYGMNEPASGKQNLHLNYHPGNKNI